MRGTSGSGHEGCKQFGTTHPERHERVIMWLAFFFPSHAARGTLDASRTMYRALQVPEIVSLIISHMNLNWSAGWGWAAIAALARTCRVFHKPAVGAKWEKPQLWELVCTMPQKVWMTNDVDERPDYDTEPVYTPSNMSVC